MAAKFNWKEDFDRARFAITSLSEEGHLSVFFSASALTVQALQAYVMTKNFFLICGVGRGINCRQKNSEVTLQRIDRHLTALKGDHKNFAEPCGGNKSTHLLHPLR